MKFAVMKHLDIMIGIDFHICWPPWLPEPLSTPLPYLTVMPMCGTFLTAEMAPTALTLGQFTMKLGTDIGPLIPHIGFPSLLTPLDILTSSSASYFGPSSVTVEGTPVAAALLSVVNLNLNCAAPISMPFGFVLCFTTHYVGMTLFDVMMGTVAIAVSVGLELVSGGIAGAATAQAQKRVIKPIAKKIAARRASKAAAQAAPNPGQAAKAAGWMSAKPLKAAAPPVKAGAPIQAGGHRPPAAKPGGWQSAKPSNPAAKPPAQAGGHRPPAAKPGGWQTAKPSNPNAKPPITMGNHRPPVKPATPVKPAKLKPKKSKNEMMGDEWLTKAFEHLLSHPFTLINELTLWLLTSRDVEELGGGDKENEESESEAKKLQKEDEARKADAAKGKKEAEEKS